TVAKLEGNKLATVQQFAPYDREEWEPSRDIESATFIGNGRVMTMGRGKDSLTVWDIENVKALVNVPVGRMGQLHFAVSPDRKLLAIGMKEGIALIDLVAAQHVATIPADGERVT